MRKIYDVLILGAGIYGLYAAKRVAESGRSVLVIEKEKGPFLRASYMNQARVHMGYHYPRSLSTARKSRNYFERFCRDFDFCIKKDFAQIYAIGSSMSWTSGKDFKKFCDHADLQCEQVDTGKYFKPGMCEAAFLTLEYTYDAAMLRDYLMNELEHMQNVEFLFAHYPERIDQDGDTWELYLQDIRAGGSCIINATYAALNEVHALTGFENFKMKYEKCEIILCSVGSNWKHLGITVMDGPFFSIMPFGKTGCHSLTSVSFTPHESSYSDTAECRYQDVVKTCSPRCLDNCNWCDKKPQSAWPYMEKLVKKYMREAYTFSYQDSYYVMKPVLQSSEIDDSRPTLVRTLHEKPGFISVLSGKVNTIYDLDGVLDFD